MSSTPQQPPNLSAEERRRLNIMKVGVLVLAVFLLIHAAPRNRLPEIYPVVRWGMFSGPRGLPENLQHHYELTVTSTEGETFTFDYSLAKATSNGDLFHTSGVADAHIIGYEVVDAAVNAPEGDVQQEYRQALLNRIEDAYDIEVADVVISEVVYEVDFEEWPFVDYDNPLETNVVANLSGEALVEER